MADDEILKGIKKTQIKMEELFKKVFSDSLPLSKRGVWMPPCDVYETEGNIIILIEIAGINKKDLRITLEGNYLHIKGFREDPSKIDGRRNYYYMELNFGPFERLVFVPCQIKARKVSVEYKQGLLKIILPKSEVGKKEEKIIEIE
ncbi:Hsp20/alpha crystallin family protein [candidate division WOR-3 bacterium]|nr:Hsp20/alpha crystallin family protein [candidate division WOR-3 bacterium]MCK4576929.1 Hsp20/alpha crystallin family protein [candidate division WOR-3 bacterium]